MHSAHGIYKTICYDTMNIYGLSIFVVSSDQNRMTWISTTVDGHYFIAQKHGCTVNGRY